MLTDERVDAILSGVFASPGENPDLWRDFARAIEAEVRAEAQEPVAWFVFSDSNGPVPLELWGFDLMACKRAVLENARSAGWKGTVEGYLLHMSWTIRPLGLITPQPPAPCNTDFEELIEQYWDLGYEEGKDQTTHNGSKANEVLHKLRQIVKTPAPCPNCAENEKTLQAIAELEKEIEVAKSAARYHATQTNEVNVVVAEQGADIERIAAENRSIDEDICHYLENEQANLSTIAQQAAEIERLNRAYEAIDEQRNRDFETIAQQSALIEQCKRALVNHRNLTRPIHETEEALAAIAVYKAA